jgi:hypothetical protein
MSEYQIEDISIDSTGRLLVHPAMGPSDSYAYIYRSAMGVHWLTKERSLVAPTPKEWSYLAWFQQIVKAVADEYGDHLVLSDTTRWSNVPGEIKAEIENWAKGDSAY